MRPNARTLRSLALTSYELRQYVEALLYLRQALVSQEHPLTDEMRAQAQTEIEECQSFIAYDRIVLEPKNATLRVDGQPPVFDQDGALMLDPGSHEIRADADGFEPFATVVTANGAERVELSFKLISRAPVVAEAPAPAPVPVAVAVTQPPATNPSLWSPLTTQKVLGLSLASGGVVGLGLGVAFSVIASSESSASKPDCPGNVCNAVGFPKRQSALSHADVATVSFIAAGALLAAGAVTFLVAPIEEQESSSIGLMPGIGPGIASLAVVGGF